MIRFEGVRKSFGGAQALDGLDLVVPEGAFAVMLGGSGAGKSTALRMINRLIEPDAGRVLLRGRDVATEPAPALRRRIGYVIQGIGLFPHWTVARNIGAVPRLLGWDARRIAARVEELLALLRLDPDAYRDRMPAQLSGGQAQRVGVARALAADPDILLMDEPFGALDAVTRQALQQEMARLHAATGKTILLVTHDVEEAFALATRLAVMADGRLLQEGAPRDLLDAPADPRVRDLLDGGAIGMRRLALVTAASLAGPLGEPPATLPRIPATATGREALEAMLAARAEAVVLLDEQRRPGGPGRAAGPAAGMRVAPLLPAVLFAAALLALPATAPGFGALFPEVAEPLYRRETFLALTLSHAWLVLASLLPAAVIGIGLGIAATRPGAREVRVIADALVGFAQAVPPVAVIAIAVPVIGFGAAPALVALVCYATLPVLRATTGALATVPRDVMDAARGSGMTPRQVLVQVELPLAAPPILAGLRVAAVLAVATAAVGAVAGASCLGTPIIAGLVNGNPAWVVQGALLTGLMAFAVDGLLGALARAPA